MSEKGASQKYLSALEEVQKSARWSKDITDGLQDQQKDTNDTLREQTEESADALHTLEGTVPLWQRMGELTTRDVPYEPFEAWQKEAWERVHPAQKDFFSGEASRLRKGANKVRKARAAYEDMRDGLYQGIETQQKNVEKRGRWLSNAEDRAEDAQSARSDDRSSNRRKAFLNSYRVVGPMALLAGCFAGGDLGPAFLSALIVPLVIGWPLFYVYYESRSSSDNKLKNAQAKESKSKRTLAKAKSKLEDLYSYADATAAPGTSGVREVMIFSDHKGVFHRAPDRNSDPYVEEGDKIKSGDVICMIEIERIQKREIQSNVAGIVKKIFPSRSQSVEFEQPLFVIRSTDA